MKDFKFSIITAIYNSERYLEETIESVISQDIGFEDNVQLILVDDGSTDKSRDIAMGYGNKYPNNILVLTKENGGVASARNLGLKHVEGKYINFMDSDDKLSPNTLTAVEEFFKKHPDVKVASIPLKFFDKREGDHYLNYKFENEGIIDLDKKYDYPQLHISSSFIEFDALKDYEFNTCLINGSDSELLTRVLIDLNRYGVINSTYYHYRKRQDESSIMDTAKTSKRFFTEKMRLYYKNIINECIEKKGFVTPYIQYLILLDIGGIIKSPYFDDIFNIKEEIDEFWQCLDDIFSYIDIDIILNHRYYNHDVKMFLVFLKTKEFHTQINPKKHKLWLKSNDIAINRMHKHNIYIKSIDIENKNLVLKGYFSSNCKTEAIRITAVLNNGEAYTAEYLENESYIKRYLGINWKFKYHFLLEIPLNCNDFKFELIVEYSEDDKYIDVFNDTVLKETCIIPSENGTALNNTYNITFDNNEFHLIKKSLKDRVRSLFQ